MLKIAYELVTFNINLSVEPNNIIENIQETHIDYKLIIHENGKIDMILLLA